MLKKKRQKHENITVSGFLILNLLLGFGIMSVLLQTPVQVISNSDFEPVTGFEGIMESSIVLKTDSHRTPVAAAPTDFISHWDTTLISSGSSNNNQIRLPLESSGMYDFIVDWGDGDSDHIVLTNYSSAVHTYASTGEYTLIISGTLIGWRFNDNGDKLKLLDIIQWGTMGFGNSDSYFNGCINLDLTAIDSPDLTGTTSMHQAFRGCINLGDFGNINNWDTSSVTDMSFMFSVSKIESPIGDPEDWFYGESTFDFSINNWNTSFVTNMRGMFSGAAVFNQSLGTWNTSSVTDMGWMFWGADTFNQPLGTWNTSSVTDMSGMFRAKTNCMSSLAFNKPLGTWDTSSVTDMNNMFRGSKFNQSIGTWDTSSVTNMDHMFTGSDFKQPIGTWDTSSVTDMSLMFASNDFNQPIGNWDTSGVTHMSGMFWSNRYFNQPIEDWDVSNVLTMRSMFRKQMSGNFAFNQPLGKWDVSKVTDMHSMFKNEYGATVAFDQPLGDWDISSVNSMENMFEGMALSTDNYDHLLIGWAKDSLHSNVIFNGGQSKYSLAANDARQLIIDTYKWTITDGGLYITDLAWMIEPEDRNIYEGGAFSYQVSAIDPNGIDIYWLNDTSIFNIDDTGLITNIATLEVGVYHLKVFVNNTGGYQINSSFSIFVQEDDTLTWIIEPEDRAYMKEKPFPTSLEPQMSTISIFIG